MKLATKMTLVLVSAMTLVMGVHLVSSIAELRAQLEADVLVDNAVKARTLAEGIAAVYRQGGEQAARDLVERVDRDNPDISFAWVTPSGDVAGGHTPGPEWAETRPTVETTAPVAADGGSLGWVSVIASLQDDHDFMRLRIERILLTTIVMAFVGATIVLALGRRYVTAPVRALSAKAARIGRGDFTGPLAIRGRDELAGLAKAMNAMADELVETHRRVHEESRARLNALEQLRHAERLATVGKLGAGIAHELGTPLNVIDARAQMIASGEVSAEEVPVFATMIRGQAARMASVVRQLLGFARMQPTSPERTDLRALVGTVGEFVRPLAARRHVSVVLEPGPPRIAEVDTRQIEQVFANIVMNAIQACSEGGSVRLSVHDDDAALPPDVAPAPAGFVCVRIEDDGKGICAEHLARVFEPFFTTKEVGQGTGLGLSVAYGIVREHGGWLDVRSEPGRGSTFKVHLPNADSR